MVESECVAKITFPLSRNSTEDFCWSKSRIEERKGSVCERGEKGCGWVESTHTHTRERGRERGVGGEGLPFRVKWKVKAAAAAAAVRRKGGRRGEEGHYTVQQGRGSRRKSRRKWDRDSCCLRRRREKRERRGQSYFLDLLRSAHRPLCVAMRR